MAEMLCFYPRKQNCYFILFPEGNIHIELKDLKKQRKEIDRCIK